MTTLSGSETASTASSSLLIIVFIVWLRCHRFLPFCMEKQCKRACFRAVCAYILPYLPLKNLEKVQNCSTKRSKGAVRRASVRFETLSDFLYGCHAPRIQRGVGGLSDDGNAHDRCRKFVSAASSASLSAVRGHEPILAFRRLVLSSRSTDRPV